MKQLIRKPRTATMASACLLGAAAFLFACCSQDELPGAGGANARPDGIAALHIASATLQVPQTQPGTRATSAATRAAAAPLTTGSIGVFRSKGTGYAEALANKQYTYTAANGWQPSAAADTVYLMANDADVCAYFPYNSAYTDVAAIPLASGKYTGTADDLAKHDTLDICYDVNRTLNGALTATDFTMKHAMAMVQLSFERLNYDSDNCNLTSVSIKNKELISTATLNIGTGAYTTVTNAALTWTPGATDPATGIQVPATGVSAPTSALLVPCTLDAAGTTFGFTVDGQKMSVKVPAATLSALTAGKIYKLKFIIHAASITLSDVSIIDWTSAWSAGSEPNIDGTPKDYIELGGVKWAISNLEYNATHRTYGFAATVTAYGSYFEWNALTPEKGTHSQILEWDEDNDPCRRMEPKGTWSTPTYEELNKLKGLKHIWTAGYNGVAGYWFGTNNADEAAASPDRYLFLPAAGLNDRGNGVKYENTKGEYWSSTDYGSEWLIFANGMNISKTVLDVNYNYRDNGFSVRCVKRKAVVKDYIEVGGSKWAKGNLYRTASGDYYVAEKQGDFYDATVSPVAEWSGYTQYFLFEWAPSDSGIMPHDYDKCRKVTDGGWCVPTRAQQQALINGAHVFGYYVNAGGHSVAGMYFGTSDKAEAESHPDKYIFLPYTGRANLNWDGTEKSPASNVGRTADYMNTAYGGAGIINSWIMGDWNGDGSYPLDKVDYTFMDDSGSSIRCVKATD